MKKQIRKAIIEAKEKKETLLIEEKIIKSRLLVIFENTNNIKNFNSLSEKKKLNMSFRLMNEINYLQQTGLIKEDFDLTGIFKGLFGNIIGGGVETFVEPFVNSFLSAIGLSGYWKNVIISFVTNNPARIVKAFSNCKEMTKILAEALVEGVVMTFQKEKGLGGFGYDLIRNTLLNTIDKSAIGQKFEEGLSETVCGLFGKIGDNAKKVSASLGGLKNAELQPAVATS
jgi:hypothetical protein